SLPQAFGRAGYQTAVTGKIWHAVPPRDRAGQFQTWGHPGGAGAKPGAKLIPPTPGGNHPLMDWGAFPHRDEQKGDYQVASWAAGHLKKLPKDKPFFLAAGFFLPHVPCHIPPEWLAKIPDDDSVLPAIREDDREDTPRFSWNLHWDLPEPRLKWVRDNHQWRNLARSYLACTLFVDAQVGRVLEALRESGHEKDTVVVLCSDHGFHLGEKLITGKNTLWERSTRVPLVVAGRGVERPGVCARPVELLDIYPTLMELAGVQGPDGLEGKSLVPLLKDPLAQGDRVAVTTHNRGNHSVRDERYRYIRYADGSEELYDLVADPREWTNLAGEASVAAVKARLRGHLPRRDVVAAPGSQQRVLEYDPATGRTVWEGKEIRKGDPVP
ncbi:MAG: sulfatase-like hydrolase/transferase, partial [Gemmataceae bacterium]